MDIDNCMMGLVITHCLKMEVSLKVSHSTLLLWEAAVQPMLAWKMGVEEDQNDDLCKLKNMWMLWWTFLKYIYVIFSDVDTIDRAYRSKTVFVLHPVLCSGIHSRFAPTDSFHYSLGWCFPWKIVRNKTLLFITIEGENGDLEFNNVLINERQIIRVRPIFVCWY